MQEWKERGNGERERVGGTEDWWLAKSLLEMHKANENGPQCLAGAPHMVTGS